MTWVRGGARWGAAPVLGVSRCRVEGRRGHAQVAVLIVRLHLCLTRCLAVPGGARLCLQLSTGRLAYSAPAAACACGCGCGPRRRNLPGICLDRRGGAGLLQQQRHPAWRGVARRGIFDLYYSLRRRYALVHVAPVEPTRQLSRGPLRALRPGQALTAPCRTRPFQCCQCALLGLTHGDASGDASH